MQVLEMPKLQELVPAAFAKEPAARMSEEYQFIDTVKIIDAMTDLNYYPVRAMQTRSRKAEKKGYAKHMIVFRTPDAEDLGEYTPELLYTGSHDGTALAEWWLGVFRQICSNGLVVKTADYGLMSVKHKGASVEQQVEAAIQEVGERVPVVQDAIRDWRGLGLSPDQEHELAVQMLRIRYGEVGMAPVLPQELYQNIRRQEDTSNDLWTVFNRMQENVMKGGLSSGFRGERRMRTTRPIRGVSETIRFNSEAWAAADALAKELLRKAANSPVEALEA